MFGIHVAKKSKVLTGDKGNRKDMLKAIAIDTSELEINAVQIFTHGPRNMTRSNMDHENIKKYCKKNGIYTVVHSTYLTHPWSISDGTAASKRMFNHISDQLNAAGVIGAHGLVIHLPKYKPNISSDAVLQTLKMLEPICQKEKVAIFLEIEAHKPSESYGNPEHLNELCDLLINELSAKTWGITVDTAHIWASEIDLRKPSDTKNWLNSIKYPHKITLVHFNGSPVPFGSHKDMHAIAFSKDDVMWPISNFDIETAMQTGGYKILKFCKKNNIPVICEINRGSEKDTRSSLKLIESIL